eukprot:COSAG02_NODE_445_length_22163_cov_55.680611_5_plen_104_part_00
MEQVSAERHDAIQACCKQVLSTGGKDQNILAMVRRGVAIDQVRLPTLVIVTSVSSLSLTQVSMALANLEHLLTLQLEEQLKPYGLAPTQARVFYDVLSDTARR